MRELALFAGVGGGILGGKLLGWETVCAVEINEYCRRVLMQRQDDGVLEPFPIWGDIRTFRGRPWRGLVDVVSGGFPCTDISDAGHKVGITGARSGLWKEMARVICEIRPKYVFVENVSALLERGMGTVLGDLASMRYDARWASLGTADCGGQHVRMRTWILAHDSRSNDAKVLPPKAKNGQNHPFEPRRAVGRVVSGTDWDAYQPGLAGLADAFSHIVERVSAIGNTQDPIVAARAWEVLGGPMMNLKHDAAG